MSKKKYFIFAFFICLFAISLLAQDPREKNHSMNILPFVESGIQKYYVTWSSSSGSDNGWQHDIYNQIISFSTSGDIVFDTNPHRYIGTSNDEAQEPVNISINSIDNTILSVWEDGSGSTVDIRGQMHKPDGTIIKSNWVISGGEESQHSPEVVHLNGFFLVSLTDEASPAQSSMNEARLLNNKTGEQIGTLNLSPKDEDNWWVISVSNNRNYSFIGWGNGENFYGSVVKVSSDSISSTKKKFYISSIYQYYYSTAWLENLSKFIVITKVKNNSIACLIDTNGIRSNFTTIKNAPITRETKLAVAWNTTKKNYEICYTSGTKDLAIISVSNEEIKLAQINENILLNGNWTTTGIACQFVYSVDGKDLWKLDRKILISYNDNNSNDAIYRFLSVEDLTSINKNDEQQIPNEIVLFNAYPNPFNPSTKIRFSISTRNNVLLEIYNVNGELIDILIDKREISRGTNEVYWNGKDLNNKLVSSGVYITKLTVGDKIISKRILLIK